MCDLVTAPTATAHLTLHQATLLPSPRHLVLRYNRDNIHCGIK